MDPEAPPSGLKLAFGPVGAAGLVLALLGLLRGRPSLVALGGGALAADALVPSLRGLAALRAEQEGGAFGHLRGEAGTPPTSPPSSATATAAAAPAAWDASEGTTP